MIEKVKITSGFAHELTAIKDKTFEFAPGLNLLFGPNGCGKTSLLKIAAGYSAIDTTNRGWGGGWSKTPRAWGDNVKFPESFQESTVGHCSAEVIWDGTPSFYGSANLSDNTTMSQICWENEESPDGMTGGIDHIQMIMSKHSEGETREINLGRMHKVLKTIPKFRENELFDKYLETLPKNGPPTVFLDEPDRSLDFDKQVLVWLRYLPDIAKTKQVIVASHSVVPLLAMEKLEKVTKVNFIDFDPEYTEKSRHNLKFLGG